MIQKIKAKIEAEGKAEQKSYDKYACWCERTMDEKAAEIAAAKLRIKVLIKLITKISMEIGICTADIDAHSKAVIRIKSDIEVLVEQRTKSHEEWLADKSEAEQYMGALEAAINVLSTATQADKGGIISSLQQTKFLSVAAGLRGALQRISEKGGIPETDLEIMNNFVGHPEDFLHPKTGEFLQAGSQNPFGDYAPKSGQIQGILKEMYDEYARDLERGSGEEAMAQKNFLRLKATKEEELRIESEAHEFHLGDCAAKEQQRSDWKLELAALKKKLKADIKFFEETKASCKEKATLWSTRCRIRTSEILGINKALEILDSPEAQKTFQAAATTLLQVSARSNSHVVHRAASRSADPWGNVDRNDAYSHLRALATKHNSLMLGQIAAALKTGGHFDKVIAMIDEMVKLLEKEGMDDIEHRDRCESGTTKNKQDAEDVASAIAKAKEEKEILEDKATKLWQDINALASEIEETKKAMEDRLDLRNQEVKEFKQALKDDAAAVKLLSAAMAAMSSFKGGFLQKGRKEPEGPEYTIDKNKAPEDNFSGEYSAKDSESAGIVSIMEMLKEDLETEMKDSRAEDAEAEAKYEEEYGAMSDTLEAQEGEKVALEKALADTKEKVADLEELLDKKHEDAVDIGKMGEALAKDCAWVATEFDARKEARETEIAGLQEAKNILAGAE